MANNNEETTQTQINGDEIDAQIQSVNAEIAKLQGQINGSFITADNVFVQTTYGDGHYMVHHKTENPDAVKDWYSEKATTQMVKGGMIIGGILGVVGTAVVCSIFSKNRRH